MLSSTQTQSAPLPGAGSLPHAHSGGLGRMFSGSHTAAAAHAASACASPMIGAETVAPCMRGANKNKALVKELAAEVSLHPDALMHALRTAAIQGTLAEHSSAPAAPAGSVPEHVERALQRLAAFEGCPVDKLRGWLLRVPGMNPFGGAAAQHDGKAGAVSGTAAAPMAAYDPHGAPAPAGTPPIRAHYGGGGSGGGSRGGAGAQAGRRSGWDVCPPIKHGSGSLAGGRRHGADSERW